MKKIVFVGAGSIIFVKNLIGDCMSANVLKDAEYALLDIDSEKLNLSLKMLKKLNSSINNDRAEIKAYSSRKEAFRNADFVINAIQVGGYDPYVLKDFSIPAKYGIDQIYADTLGIGGIFRGLRTIPVILEILRDMEEMCPDALFINYANPMAMIMGSIFHSTTVHAVGLCHSVQKCAQELLSSVGMQSDDAVWEIAGINHQAWLLRIERDGIDLYPEIKKRSRELGDDHQDAVRHQIMHHFGYYVTESSLHSAEYMPYFLKSFKPEQLSRFHLDPNMYRSWGESQKSYWKNIDSILSSSEPMTHNRTEEYASFIMEAVIENRPVKIGANVLNDGLIENLPKNSCVEVPCVVDSCGITPCHVGRLPEQCAGLNRTNINVQLLVMEAVRQRKREPVYHAAMLDPRTSQELSLDEIVSLCDEMFEAGAPWLDSYMRG